MGTAPIGRMLDWPTEPSKMCQTCGHPRSWHERQCWGNPKVKGLCSARCKRFKGVKKTR